MNIFESFLIYLYHNGKEFFGLPIKKEIIHEKT